MSHYTNIIQKIPDVPEYVAPPDEAVIDGESVTFQWHSVEGATSYRLEIASDTHFDSVIFGRKVEKAEPITVSKLFETNGQIYYWRVFAGNDVGWSASEDVIHGFYSATAEVVSLHESRPNHAEHLGPLTELLTGQAGHDPYFARAKPEATVASPEEADEAFFYAEEARAVEHEDVEVKTIFSRIFLTILVIVVVLISGYHATQLAAQLRRAQLAAEVSYPDLMESRAAAQEKLNTYELLDGEQGIYRIPVDSAMILMMEEELRQPRSTNQTSEIKLQK